MLGVVLDVFNQCSVIPLCVISSLYVGTSDSGTDSINYLIYCISILFKLHNSFNTISCHG